MADVKMVTRRVVKSNTYKVYKVEGTTLIEIGEEKVKGKVSEKELCKKYNVPKVVVDCVATDKAIYGMPVDEFMKYAKEISKEEN